MNQLLFRLAAAGAALLLLPSGCGETSAAEEAHMEYSASDLTFTPVDRDTPIQAVMDNPLFGDYGRLLFPVESGWWSGETLEDLRLTFYSHIDRKRPWRSSTTWGRGPPAAKPFFMISTPQRKRPATRPKRTPACFSFGGEAAAKTAICNAGGAFAYVGAMHDSFPPCAGAFPARLQRVRSDLPSRRANRVRGSGPGDRLSPRKRCGASHRYGGLFPVGRLGRCADGRMAGGVWHRGLWRGRLAAPCRCDHAVYRHERNNGKRTTHLQLRRDPRRDRLLRVMKQRTARIRAQGTDAEIEIFEGLAHGFGLGRALWQRAGSITRSPSGNASCDLPGTACPR